MNPFSASELRGKGGSPVFPDAPPQRGPTRISRVSSDSILQPRGSCVEYVEDLVEHGREETARLYPMGCESMATLSTDDAHWVLPDLPGPFIDGDAFQSQLRWALEMMHEVRAPIAYATRKLEKKGLVKFDAHGQLVVGDRKADWAEERLGAQVRAGKQLFGQVFQGRAGRSTGMNPRKDEVITFKTHGINYQLAEDLAAGKVASVMTTSYADNTAMEMVPLLTTGVQAAAIAGITLKRLSLDQKARLKIVLSFAGAMRCLAEIAAGRRPAKADLLAFADFWGSLPGWRDSAAVLVERGAKRLEGIAASRIRNENAGTLKGCGRDCVVAPLGALGSVVKGGGYAAGLGGTAMVPVNGALGVCAIPSALLQIAQAKNEVKAAKRVRELFQWRSQQLEALIPRAQTPFEQALLKTLLAYCRRKAGIAKKEKLISVSRGAYGAAQLGAAVLGAAALVAALPAALAALPSVLGVYYLGTMVVRGKIRHHEAHRQKWDERHHKAMRAVNPLDEARRLFVEGFESCSGAGDFKGGERGYAGRHDKAYKAGEPDQDEPLKTPANESLAQELMQAEMFDQYLGAQFDQSFTHEILVAVGLDPLSEMVLAATVEAHLDQPEKALGAIAREIRRLFDFPAPRPDEAVKALAYVDAFEQLEERLGPVTADTNARAAAKIFFAPGRCGVDRKAFEQSMLALREAFEHPKCSISRDEGGIYARMLDFDDLLKFVADTKAAVSVAAPPGASAMDRQLTHWQGLETQLGPDARPSWWRVGQLLSGAAAVPARDWEAQLELHVAACFGALPVAKQREILGILLDDLDRVASSVPANRFQRHLISQLREQWQDARAALKTLSLREDSLTSSD
jgi:hypothetical protein